MKKLKVQLKVNFLNLWKQTLLFLSWEMKISEKYQKSIQKVSPKKDFFIKEERQESRVWYNGGDAEKSRDKFQT